MQTIYLKDYLETAENICLQRYRDHQAFREQFTAEQLLQAIREYASGDLRYNCLTGRTHYRQELVSRFANFLGAPRYNLPKEIGKLLEEQLTGIIFNGAQRLAKGLQIT